MNTEQDLKTLYEEMQAVISNLESREWIQNKIIDGDKVCAHGAVKTCDVLRPGDEHIIRAVMRRRGLTEDWNDEDGRTKFEVLARMRQIEITDVDLADTFGPNWRQVIAVIRKAATLTPDEARRVSARITAPWTATVTAAWNVARDAAQDAARDVAWTVARNSIWDAVRAAARDIWLDATGSACEAASVVVVADLVGQHGLTQDHVNTLMKPWIEVLGEDWEKDV